MKIKTRAFAVTTAAVALSVALAVGACTADGARDKLVQVSRAVVSMADEGTPPDPAVLAIVDEVQAQIADGVPYPEWVHEMLAQVEAAGAARVPIPPLAVEAARAVVAVDDKLRQENPEQPWWSIGLDWLLLAVQVWGGVSVAGGAVSSRGQALVRAALSALNPTSGNGVDARTAFNAALALAGARHSGDVLAPKAGPQTAA